MSSFRSKIRWQARCDCKPKQSIGVCECEAFAAARVCARRRCWHLRCSVFEAVFVKAQGRLYVCGASETKCKINIVDAELSEPHRVAVAVVKAVIWLDWLVDYVPGPELAVVTGDERPIWRCERSPSVFRVEIFATQSGIWACQTNVCPCMIMSWCAAKFAMLSAATKSNSFGCGSVNSHFKCHSGTKIFAPWRTFK